MGRAKVNRQARGLARKLAEAAPDPQHADRWPWEWVPLLGRLVRRRRLAAASKADAVHAAALKKAQKKIRKRLTYISQ